jgi:hypothetical protein
MKLRTFFKNHTGHRIAGKSEISLSPNGCIRFTRQAVKLLNLTNESKIVIHQDIEARSYWYIEVTNQEGSFLVKFYKNSSQINSKEIVQELAKSIGRAPGRIKFQIKETPFKYEGRHLYQIITKNS